MMYLFFNKPCFTLDRIIGSYFLINHVLLLTESLDLYTILKHETLSETQNYRNEKNS
jgi:hypothetical protein